MNIAEDNLEKFSKFTETPPHPAYISGFIDGDGTIYIRKIKDGYQVGISISQCRSAILYILKHHFGGEVSFNLDKKEGQRNCHFYINRGKTLPFLVNYIKDYILIKKIQINAVNNILSLLNKPNFLEEKEKYFQECFNQNKEKIQLDIPDLKIEWIAGLFDAEGNIQLTERGVRIKITQKNNVKCLEKIKEYFGYGKVDKILWVIYSKENCLDFCNKIKNHLIVKRNQIEKVLEYFETKNIEIKEFIQLEKHLSDDKEIIYPNLGSQIEEKLKLKYIEVKTLKMEEHQNKMEEFKKKQSERMKGENNPNFGKELSKEHSQKISQSTFGKNRNLSDQQILEILELKGKETQEKIAEKYNVSRATIYKIHSGKLVPTSDYQKHLEKKEEPHKKDWIKSFGYSDEEVNVINGALSKRNLEGKTMALIWYYGKLSKTKNKYPIKLSAPKLSEYFTEKLGKKVSIDMIKNIWNKKTKLYKFDFETFNYQNYLDDKIDNEEWIEI